MEEKVQKLAMEESPYETVEKEFQEVLTEMTGEKTLDNFHVKYSNLMTALKKSQENEKRLMTKCRELNAEIKSNSVKVEAALKQSHEDQTTIMFLKKEIEKAWEMVDAAHEKEKAAQETNKNLQKEIENLKASVKQTALLSAADVQSVGELLKLKKQLTDERDELLSKQVIFREDLEKATTKQNEAEEAIKKAQDTIFQLQQDIQVLQNDCSRESRMKEKLEKELKQLRADAEAQQLEIKTLSGQCQRGSEEQQRLEQNLQEQKILNERVSKELEQLQVRNTKLQRENEQNTLSLEQLTYDNNQRVSELKMEREEVTQMKQEISNLTKIRETTHKKLRLLEDQKLDVEQQRETLRNQITGMEKEMEMNKIETENYKKKINGLTREKEMLTMNLIKAEKATEKQIDLVKLEQQSKIVLEQEILNCKHEAQKQRKIIYELEKERDRNIDKASGLKQKIIEHMNELKSKEMEICEDKKKIAEAETKLKQQQNLYEAMRAERNNYSKNLLDAQHDITDLKRKMKSMSQENGQLTEEIKSKETALSKEHQAIQHLKKEKESLKAELQRMKQQAQDTKKDMEIQKAEEHKLLKIIADADAEKAQQKKELDQVITERDMLRTQLVQRNEDLALLSDKIKILHSILKKGEIQYDQRMEDIRLLKLEIKKLRTENTVLNKTVSNAESLKHEVFIMQKELVKERTKCERLQEDLENPLNVHRWRILAASDPSTFELIQKIYSLQGLLIRKNDEIMRQELLLLEKEKLYVELKHIIARQPGPEAAEQLYSCQQHLKKKNKQLKVLTAELNMQESQTQNYKYEIEQVTAELQNVKKKYFMLKRKEQACRSCSAAPRPRDEVMDFPACFSGDRAEWGGFTRSVGDHMDLYSSFHPTKVGKSWRRTRFMRAVYPASHQGTRDGHRGSPPFLSRSRKHGSTPVFPGELGSAPDYPGELCSVPGPPGDHHPAPGPASGPPGQHHFAPGPPEDLRPVPGPAGRLCPGPSGDPHPAPGPP